LIKFVASGMHTLSFKQKKELWKLRDLMRVYLRVDRSQSFQKERISQGKVEARIWRTQWWHWWVHLLWLWAEEEEAEEEWEVAEVVT